MQSYNNTITETRLRRFDKKKVKRSAMIWLLRLSVLSFLVLIYLFINWIKGVG